MVRNVIASGYADYGLGKASVLLHGANAQSLTKAGHGGHKNKCSY